jgi:hypothetical protein
MSTPLSPEPYAFWRFPSGLSLSSFLLTGGVICFAMGSVFTGSYLFGNPAHFGIVLLMVGGAIRLHEVDVRFRRWLDSAPSEATPPGTLL